MAYTNEAEETLARQELETLQRRKLAAMWEAILPDNRFYERKFRDVEFDPMSDPLSKLPFTYREEIERDQLDHPPYGTNLTFPLDRYTRFHQTSGSTGQPMRWLDTPENWAWWHECWGVIFAAAGITDSDRFLFPFSFGPFVGFWGAFEAAVARGNLSVAAGGMSTEARLNILFENELTVICCTPTYALRMAEVAADQGIDLSGLTVRALIVAGEPGGNIPATRQRIESAWGARVFDHSGMTEIGPVGFECEQVPGGLHLMENQFIAEVIERNGMAPVADGHEGELVLTNLGRWASPLIRYRTGDLVRARRQQCKCGRHFVRLDGGILGRIDDMFSVRGNSVYPGAIEAIIRAFPSVAEFRAEVRQTGSLVEVRIELEPVPKAKAPGLAGQVREAIRNRLNFRAEVVTVAPGTLPRFEMKARRFVRRDGVAGDRVAGPDRVT